MSGTEDYLDGLLNSMEGKKAPQSAEAEPAEDMGFGTEGVRMSSEDEFLNAFEKELFAEGGDEEFIRAFEKELDEGADANAGAESTSADVLLESLDGIVNSAKQELEADASPDEGLDDLMVDTLGDFPSDVAEAEDNAVAQAPEAAAEENGFVDDDADLMDLLQSEGDFSDIEDMLKADENHTALADEEDSLDAGMQTADAETTDGEDAETEGGKRRKRGRKSKESADGEQGKNFFQRISAFLFGEGDAEAEADKKKPEPVKVTPSAPSIEDLSDENLQILQALEGSPETAAEPAAPEEQEDEKEKKKLEKAAKREKAKKEKAEKKAQAKKEKEKKKAQKVKKPKPPKEPDRTPPLPKKPVILIFVMVASFLALVLVGTNLFGYSHSMDEAKKAYDLGDYKLAYTEVSGLEIKESDMDTYEKYFIMANTGGEYSAYQTFMSQGIYDMALDCLIRTIGRCDKYSEAAESYGCTKELTNVRNQAVGALAAFGLTEERAVELYAVDEREEYSSQLYAVLAAAGLSVD